MQYKKVKNDINGNCRYVVQYLDLGLEEYRSLTQLGLKKYRGKDFKGGYVFTSYNPEKFISWVIKEIKKRGL